MVDTIIKGTGNSRTLKTVPNAAALYPDFQSMLQAMADGTFPIDIGPLNPLGCDVVGTPLNAATLTQTDIWSTEERIVGYIDNEIPIYELAFIDSGDYRDTNPHEIHNFGGKIILLSETGFFSNQNFYYIYPMNIGWYDILGGRYSIQCGLPRAFDSIFQIDIGANGITTVSRMANYDLVNTYTAVKLKYLKLSDFQIDT